jgi:SAM-dependent methyltransferase
MWIYELLLIQEVFMSDVKVPGAEKWAAFYRSGQGNLLPDENLVRLVKGRYAEIPRSGRVLDVGFGRGANLIMFANSGYECYGLEVNKESIEAATELSKQAGVNLRLGLLSGPGIAYPDEYFDIVLSWGAVYYHGTRSLVANAIREFFRVTRVGGVLLMSVIHPNSFMVRRLSDDLGDGTHLVDREDAHDNRYGMKIFYDATSSGWRRLLNVFDEVDEGYAEIDLFAPKRRDAWRFFLARKTAK